MNDRELDQLIARANPFGDEAVRQLPTADAGSELLEEIMTTTAPAPELKPIRRRRTPFVIAAAAAVAIAVAVVGALFPHGNPAAPSPAYGAEMIAVAKANQRLLVGADGWKITSVGQFTRDEGQLTFSKGTQQLGVTWRPTGLYNGYLTDRRADGSNPSQPIKVLGQTGTLFRYGNTSDHTTILPPKGDNFLELRADLGSEQAYRDLIATLHQVDVNTWLDALPPSVVKPADSAKVVTEMLVGIPVPAGFDPKPLVPQNALDRYQVGAEVAKAISCGWLDQWTKAKKTGDAAKAREAVTAMKTSHSWKFLLQMNAEGDYPEAVWQYADAIAKDQVPVGYRQGLGCN
jgi:hypothetical protein